MAELQSGLLQPAKWCAFASLLENSLICMYLSCAGCITRAIAGMEL